MFASAKHDPKLGERNSQCANELHKLAVRHRKERTKSASCRTQPRQAYVDLRLPAAFEQIFQMRRKGDRFILPGRQTNERSDAKPAKTSRVTALDAIEPKVKIALRSGSMHLRINAATVGLLVNDESFRSCLDNRHIIFCLHRAYFDGD